MILKISAAPRRATQGHVLAMVLVVVTICAIALMSYLQLVNAQNKAVARSQGWNSAVPVMEAGVEEALAHLNANCGDTSCDLAIDGWVRIGNYYRLERAIGQAHFVVTIVATNTRLPIVESRGFCKMPLLAQNNNSPYFLAQIAPPNYPPPPSYPQTYGSPREGHVGRGVQIKARRNGSLMKAMLAKGRIDIGGTVRVDSYNSCDPALSTLGEYDPTKVNDKGDIASNGQFVKQISAGGDVQIKGHLSTGPGGTIGMNGDNVSVGSEEFVDGGYKGVEQGWMRDDMNANIPDSPPPPNVTYYTGLLSGGLVGGVYYNYILPSGNYELSQLQLNSDQKILITGNVVLKVNGDVQMTGSSSIQIAPTGQLEMYVNGSTATLGGQGIINQSTDPWRFTYYGAKTNTRVNFAGGSAFYGTIYAPYAELNLAGGSLLYGGTVSKTLKATGGFTMHYDECLSSGGKGRYIVTNWDEMTPPEVARVP